MRASPRLYSLAGLVVGAALIAAACSSAASTPGPAGAGSPAAPANNAPMSITLGTTNDPTLGAYLTGQGGMTIYHLTKDSPDTSTCTGTCATNWPPVAVASGATIQGPSGATGTFATITRPDGIVQVTYDHQPLYYYSGDSVAGDTKGQGKNNTWFVAPLTAAEASAAMPSATNPAAAQTAAPTPNTSYGY